MTRSEPPPSLDEIRSWFPITSQKVYLANGNINPCARPVREAMVALLDVWTRGGDEAWAAGWTEFEKAKELFAHLVGTTADTLASIPNTTTGINLAARIIAPRPGSNVVVDDLSHMSNVYPWLQMQDRGVEVRHAREHSGRVPLEEIAALVDERTAAIDVCHVSMASGFRHDLRGLCDLARRHGAALVVDAAQSAGAVRIDLAETPVDFLAAPTFKWLLGPLGAGFLHVRADWIERAPPPMIGWMAVTNPGDNDLRAIRLHPTAMRFERGVLDMVAFAGARAGLEILHRVGMERVESRILDLSDRLHGGLRALADKGVRLWTPPARAERAGIVAFDVPDRARLHGRLEADGIHTLDYLGHIRVDPSFYNTEEEIERLLEKLREWL